MIYEGTILYVTGVSSVIVVNMVNSSSQINTTTIITTYIRDFIYL